MFNSEALITVSFSSFAGQRPLCIRDVQTAAGGLEEHGAQGPRGSSDPEGLAPGGACHNPGQNVRRITGVH